MNDRAMQKDLSPADINRFSRRSTWVLDVDDCLYDMACGLHENIKNNIIRVYAQMAANDEKGTALKHIVGEILSQQGYQVESLDRITKDELGYAFPAIVQASQSLYPDSFHQIMDQFYGDDYHLIKPDRELIDAFNIAISKGIQIYLYTNGPSSSELKRDLHVQKILQSHGCDDDFINQMRGRCYDLLMSVAAGFGKPSPQGMQHMIQAMKINPYHALMADDGIKNLKTAHECGMAVLWTWTHDKPPSEKDKNIANVIQAPRVRLTGHALKHIALAYKAS